MLDRTVPPHIQPFTLFNPTLPTGYTLSNGIPVKIFHDSKLELLHLAFRLNAGSIYEEKKRVSIITYTLLRECHPTMNAGEFDDFLDFYGCTLNILCSAMGVNIEVVIPKKNYKIVVPTLLEILKNPIFKEDTLTKVKEKSLKDLAYNKMQCSYRNAQLLNHSLINPKLVYAKILEPNDIERITVNDLHDFHQKTCCATNMRIYLAGDIDSEIEQWSNAQFEQLQRGTAMPIIDEIVVQNKPQRISEPWESAQQTSFSLSKPLFSIHHEDMHPFSFLCTLFCNYFGSRLMQNLREKNGYTYGVSGNVLYLGDSSYYSITSEINNNSVEQVIDACRYEMRRMREELVPEEEMTIVRNYMNGRLLRQVDGVTSLLRLYYFWEDFGFDHQYYYDAVDSINNISSKELQRLAERYLQEDSFTIITVGNS